MTGDSSASTANRQPVRMYDGCYVELRDGAIRGPVTLRTDVEPHMRPWVNGTEAWFDHGGCQIEGGESPWDVVRVLPARHPGLELAIAIVEARLPLYNDIGQINALREVIGCIRSASDERTDSTRRGGGRHTVEDRGDMVLRTAYLPKSIDLKLHQVGVYASHSSKSEALGDLVCSGLEAMREGSVEISRCTEPEGDETVVLRSVWFTPEIDNELQRRAFRRSQRRGQLVIDLISNELSRRYGSAEADDREPAPFPKRAAGANDDRRD